MDRNSSVGLANLKNRQAAWREQHDELMQRRSLARKSTNTRPSPLLSTTLPTVPGTPRRREPVNPLTSSPASGHVPTYPGVPTGPSLTAFNSPIRRPQSQRPRRRLSAAPDASAFNEVMTQQNEDSDLERKTDFERRTTPLDEDPVLVRVKKRAETRADVETRMNFETCVALGKKHNHSPLAVKQQMDVFFQFDLNRDGVLSKEEFEGAIKHLCHLPEDEKIPMRILGAQVEKDINFEDFLLWSFSHAFVEDRFCVNDEDKTLRKLAKDNNWSLWDVEEVKKTFDSYDKTGTGTLDLEEFAAVLAFVLGAKTPADLSRATLTRYFREVDVDGGGDIDFEEFAQWWFNRGVMVK